jgi:hypothetical protein
LLPRERYPPIAGAWWCGHPQLVGEVIFHAGAAIAVNPQQRLVATLIDSATAHYLGLIGRQARTKFPVISFVDDLDDCRLDEHGLVTPAKRRLQDAQARESARRPPTSPAGPVTPHPQPMGQPTAPRAGDPRQAEFLRRAQGKTTEERLALLREIFLPPGNR